MLSLGTLVERTMANIENGGKARIGRHKHSGKLCMGKEGIVEKGDAHELSGTGSHDDY